MTDAERDKRFVMVRAALDGGIILNGSGHHALASIQAELAQLTQERDRLREALSHARPLVCSCTGTDCPRRAPIDAALTPTQEPTHD